jgi:hypothetical protein
VVDLVVHAGSTLTIGPTFVQAPRYDVFRMEAGATIYATVDLAIVADRAEFAENCMIDARGGAGASGTNGVFGPGGPGGNGLPGQKGHNVKIEAALAKVGGLTVTTDGGAGGNGGAGGSPAPVPPPQSGLPGGPGGAGGAGGDAGELSLIWTRATPGLPTAQDASPGGHLYRSNGGSGGAGGPGGGGGGGFGSTGPMGPTGTVGLKGKTLTPHVTWRADVAALLWSQVQDIGPPARTGHGMAFDPARGKLVLFGGLAGGKAAGDTWEWDGTLWSQVADTGPSPRAYHGMAYDPAGHRVLVFGGAANDDAQDRQYLNDTWGWDGQLWVQLADTGPSARQSPAMATDSKRQRVVLFSGGKIGPEAANLGTLDTWEWDGAQWAQVADTGPSARLAAQLAWDETPGVLLLFGGAGAGPALSDSWTWDGAQWKQVADTGPSPRFGHAMASADQAVLLFGGLSVGGGGRLNDTWAWRKGAWAQTQDMGPVPRSGHAMAHMADDARARVTLFGGEGSGVFQDTWQLAERL